MTARSVVISLLSLFVASAALAQNHGGTIGALPTNVILIMFTTGVIGIAAAWIAIPMIFAKANKLDQLIELLRHGTVIRFVTITYIVIVVVILGLTDRVDGDKVATLLAGIAGYVLGQGTTHARDEMSSDDTARRPTQASDVNLVRPDERPRPAPAAETSAS